MSVLALKCIRPVLQCYRQLLGIFRFIMCGVIIFIAQPSIAENSQFVRIEIEGETPRNGFFDLSIEYDDSGTGWMAYSRIELPKHVETHIAKSVDGGETWQHVGVANRSQMDTILIDNKVRKGVWRYETPTLVFDREALPARRWKLFVQRYLTLAPYRETDRLFAQGWVEYRYAATPAGPWSEGVCLFGRLKNNCRVDLNTLHLDLQHNQMYNELGSIYMDGVLYLSMDVSISATGLGQWRQHKIVLVASRDHGITWDYVGTLTDFKDAEALGYVVLTGSSLVEEDGRLFMLATPSGAKGLFKKKRGHDGTIVLAFEDISRAKLKRDAQGKLVVFNRFSPDLKSLSGGLSDYDGRNLNGGVLFSQINLHDKPEVFQIFSTRQRAVPAEALVDQSTRK